MFNRNGQTDMEELYKLSGLLILKKIVLILSFLFGSGYVDYMADVQSMANRTLQFCKQLALYQEEEDEEGF